MSWTDYRAPTAEIPLGGGNTGTVRGLNLDDLSTLVSNHLDPIVRAVELYTASQKDVFTKANLHAFVIQLVKEFPALVNEVVALAAEEPTLAHKKIAMGVQIAALDAIVRLTLEEVSGLGNLSLVLANLVKGALGEGPMAETLSEIASPVSIGESEKT